MAIGRTTWVSLVAQAERRSGCSLRDLPEVPFRYCILTAGAEGCNALPLLESQRAESRGNFPVFITAMMQCGMVMFTDYDAATLMMNMPTWVFRRALQAESRT